jgi:hypothetical protein
MRKMKRLRGESRSDMLAYQYDRVAAPDAKGVKDSGAILERNGEIQ